MKNTKLHFSIWGLALCYFIFYVPYSALTKALSTGLFSNGFSSISGFVMLPTVLIGTVIGFLVILTATGWWKHAGTIKLFGKKIPFVTNKHTILSGIATAVIIATTTIAYSFVNISIVFAALLMRGGVLFLAIFVDTIYHRKIQWYSWLAFGLTLCALLIGFSQKSGFALSMAAAINIVAYLAGYFFRLQFMTYTAKTSDATSNYTYFVEEMIAAMITILVLPLLFAIINYGQIMHDLRAGYLSFFSSGFLVYTLLIGALYSCLYVFGSRIYLDQRENTFCIPINRCASLLAGVMAAIILSAIYNQQFYTTSQLMGSVVLILAIITLSTPTIMARINGTTATVQHNYIFVCPGNTGRSAMAQSICINRIKAQLIAESKQQKNIHILSAAINGAEGMPINNDARMALELLGVPVIAHKSQKLSATDILQADKIWCMSSAQKQLIIELFPESKTKLECLDDKAVIPVPFGKGIAAYVECAKKLEQVIDYLISKNEIVLS